MELLKTKKNILRQAGFSLLELTLAIAIFSLGSVGMATLLIDSNLSTKLAGERTEALLYAKEGIDAVKSIRDSNWDSVSVGVHGLVSNSGAWVFDGSPDLISGKYTREVDVVSATSTIKNVSVTVSWDLVSGRPASVVLDTILTNWRL